MTFNLQAPYKPTKPQQEAIRKITTGIKEGNNQTLLGITGSGKTFVMANVAKQYGKPTLVLAHNKTLAGQLYSELKKYFPDNKVEYFISYYDYYQPESYLPTSDTYIEKDAGINEEIEILRKRAVNSILTRKDTIIVSSVSCIYGLPNPKSYKNISLELTRGQTISRDKIIDKLVTMQYKRNDNTLQPGRFRVRGDVIDVIPSYQDEITRIELFGDEVDRIQTRHNVTNEKLETHENIIIFPTKEYVVEEKVIENAIKNIKKELEERLPELEELEAQRLKKRVKYDIEMMEEVGYCSGIENYSRHFEDRKPGERPYTLLDYFPDDFLFFIDESHQAIPQVKAMYNGDLARKKNLVEFGFRLPCAFDNRPLKFHEFETFLNQTVFVSATPAEYEEKNSKQTVKLIYRPTGLLDPKIRVHPIENQIKKLLEEVRKTVDNKGRVLITTLTKRMAEDLTEYMAKEGVRVRYMHSDIDTLDRTEIIRGLRAKEFDVLVGINLLREGLDIPEVKLVAILDADKDGFLRNERSLIQTMGRAARNSEGRVILFADKMTKSMKNAIETTRKRRQKQIKYNEKHDITPKTIKKKVPEKTRELQETKHLSTTDMKNKLKQYTKEMKQAAQELEFERAIQLREVVKKLESLIEQKSNQ